MLAEAFFATLALLRIRLEIDKYAIHIGAMQFRKVL